MARWLLGCGLLAVLTLGCAGSPKENYPLATESLNITADSQAKSLQRAITLQKLTMGQPDAGSYTIGSNDVLEIKVFEQEGMNVTSRVGGNGLISFPPLGDIQVKGLTERQLEMELQNRLRGDYLAEPHVTVLVKEIQARTVGIVGAVNLPGQYSSYGRMHLADLVSKAGGLRPEVGEVAYVIRYSQESPPAEGSSAGDNLPKAIEAETIKVDLDGLLLRGEQQWNLVLNASDLVNIPPAGSVFVTGYGIRKPGTYPLTGKMTLQQLVDLAEGLKYEADRDLLLVRADEHGEKIAYHVDYDELRASRTEDIQLRSGDKVIVDRTVMKTVLAATGRGISQVVRVVISANYRVEENDDAENNSE